MRLRNYRRKLCQQKLDREDLSMGEMENVVVCSFGVGERLARPMWRDGLLPPPPGLCHFLVAIFGFLISTSTVLSQPVSIPLSVCLNYLPLPLPLSLSFHNPVFVFVFVSCLCLCPVCVAESVAESVFLTRPTKRSPVFWHSRNLTFGAPIYVLLHYHFAIVWWCLLLRCNCLTFLVGTRRLLGFMIDRSPQGTASAHSRRQQLQSHVEFECNTLNISWGDLIWKYALTDPMHSKCTTVCTGMFDKLCLNPLMAPRTHRYRLFQMHNRTLSTSQTHSLKWI